MSLLPSFAGAGATRDEAERWATATLSEAGCETPAADAALLVADVAGEETELSPEAGGALREAVARRARREPLGYVRGRSRFRGLDIVVDERAFIPRPATEHLVEAALAIPTGARVLEPCTGSGAAALALKHERPDLRVTASDRSEGALEVARANGARLGIEVDWVQADGISTVPGGPFDAVVSNPPYVAETESGAGTLPPEIEHHEPPGAFWAGHDGLDVYRRFARELEGVSWVALETGAGQAEAVGAMLVEAGFGEPSVHHLPVGPASIVIAEGLASA
jgi:release factor glutamine methyltransferase